MPRSTPAFSTSAFNFGTLPPCPASFRSHQTNSNPTCMCQTKGTCAMRTSLPVLGALSNWKIRRSKEYKSYFMFICQI